MGTTTPSSPRPSSPSGSRRPPNEVLTVELRSFGAGTTLVGSLRSVGTSTERSSMASSLTTISPTRREGDIISNLKFRVCQYLIMIMMMIEDARWKGEEDVDEETLAIYKQLELRDRRRLATIKTNFRQFFRKS